MTKYKAENILPYNQDDKKSTQVRHMFDAIAVGYDGLNRVMTLGIDRWWRNVAIGSVGKKSPARILDVATGTGDMALLMNKKLRPQSITGIDLSAGMLAVAREKAKKREINGEIVFEQQDCLALTFADGSFDAVTVAFGVRNFEQLEKGFAEMHRVLSPGGTLMVLELSTPENKFVRALYKLYTYRIIPCMGKLLSKDSRAYVYLPQSVAVVPQGNEMLAIFRAAGFRQTTCRRLTFGACSLYLGEK